jgi:hypothetical protein
MAHAVDSGRFDVIMVAYNFNNNWPDLTSILHRAHERGVGVIAMKTEGRATLPARRLHLDRARVVPAGGVQMGAVERRRERSRGLDEHVRPARRVSRRVRPAGDDRRRRRAREVRSARRERLLLPRLWRLPRPLPAGRAGGRRPALPDVRREPRLREESHAPLCPARPGAPGGPVPRLPGTVRERRATSACPSGRSCCARRGSWFGDDAHASRALPSRGGLSRLPNGRSGLPKWTPTVGGRGSSAPQEWTTSCVSNHRSSRRVRVCSTRSARRSARVT